MGQGEVGGITCRVTCTRWLLPLAVKAPWLGPAGPILALAFHGRLRKHYSHLVGLAGKAAWALSSCLTNESADYCMLINEWAWLMSQVCLIRLEVHLGSALESGLGQKWRYSVLEACIG